MEKIDPKSVNLFYHPGERLRATIDGDHSYHTVKPIWAAPQSHPGRYLSLLDGKGKEITLVDDVDQLSSASREAVLEELRRRYLTAQVTRVIGMRQEFAATYWRVVTDRGEREFVTQSLQENAYWFSPTHLLLLDVDGNRFEILDTEALDVRSQTLIDNIL